jgi:hypothetical protein
VPFSSFPVKPLSAGVRSRHRGAPLHNQGPKNR